MQNARPFLGPALALSTFLHAMMLTIGVQPLTLRTPKPPPSELKVHLTELPKPAPEAPAPRLTLPEPQKDAIATPPLAALKPRSVSPGPRLAPSGDTPQRLSGEAALKAAEQLARDLPYPAEAVERGWQGEALVLLFLDGSGNAIAARLESSSGHAILDEAALRAARQLRALPASAPREALLPVRFRLR